MGVNKNKVRLIRANIVQGILEQLEFKRFSDMYRFCWGNMRTGVYKPDDSLLIYTDAGLYDAAWIQDYYAIFCGDVTTTDAAVQAAAKSIRDRGGHYDMDAMDMDRLTCIYLGLMSGLPQEDMEVFAKTEFDVYQMDEILSSIEKGLSKEAIAIIANAKLSPWHMNELSIAVEEGLAIEEAERMVDENLSWTEISAIREEKWQEMLYPTKSSSDFKKEAAKQKERSVTYDL